MHDQIRDHKLTLRNSYKKKNFSQWKFNCFVFDSIDIWKKNCIKVKKEIRHAAMDYIISNGWWKKIGLK